MSYHLNRVTLIGNVAAPADVKNDSMCVFNVATSESWMCKETKELKKRTEWHRVVVFSERLCKVATSKISKGSLVYVEGSLRIRKWTDKEGVDKSIAEIVVQNYGGDIIVLKTNKHDNAEPDCGDIW